jgi:hypothetical protein
MYYTISVYKDDKEVLGVFAAAGCNHTKITF